ncbi:hypothetical protein [Tessaracoccus sp.]
MCGIFGLVRNIDAAYPERASAAFVELGRLAVERGSDSAGFAAVSATTGTVHVATPAQVRSEKATLGGTTIVKAATSFTAMWDDALHLPVLAKGQVAIGHTRAATQGAKTAVNASPIAVGSLVGTHNGDVDTDTIPGHAKLRKAVVGATDSELLYQAIDDERSHRAKITDLLGIVEGRAALAWVDRSHQNRVYLARAALSPLSIAWDVDGNFYWASCPEWFHKVDAAFGGAIGFRDITLVREGTLLTVENTDGVPVVEDQRAFVPITRRSDTWLSDSIVWRGFSAKDKATDKAQTAHVVSKRISKTTYGAASYASSSHSYKGKGNSGSSAWGLDNTYSSRDRWDEYEPDPDMAYDEDTEALEFFTEEAEEAAIMWAEQGCNPIVVDACQQADTSDEQQMTLMAADYGFSCSEVSRMFVAEVLAYNTDLEVDALGADVLGVGEDSLAPMKSLLAGPATASEWDGPLTRVDLAPVQVAV